MAKTVNPKKWTASNIEARHVFASERRKLLKEPSADKRRVFELAISRQVINPEFLAREPRLAKTRWVEYGYLTPLECTELFCKTYLKVYRRYYERYRDHNGAESQQPLDPELFRNTPSEINALWRARQIADEIGVPYDIYLNSVMEWATSQVNRKQFPRPNQLYRLEQIEAAREAWEHEKQRPDLLFGENWDDRFFKLNPKLDPPRSKALSMALSKLKATNRETMFGSLMGSKDALSETDARYIAEKRFPDSPSVIDEAKTHYMMPPIKERTAQTFDRYLPPCLGMRESTPLDACGLCAFTLECRKAELIAGKLLQDKTGSSDPIACKRKEQNRIRQQRKRDKDRAARLQA